MSPRFILKLVLNILIAWGLTVCLLFGPVRSLDWPRAWVFMGVYVALTFAFLLGVGAEDMDLMKERMNGIWRKGQPLADRILVVPLLASYVGLMALIPRDVFRWHVLPRPPIAVSSLGLVIYLLGNWIVYRAMKANHFAAAAVRVQKERGHVVIDTGPYRFVRHPMYAGGILLFIGLPLWLESYFVTLLQLIPIVLMAGRTWIEESLLCRELPGYSEYRRRVRYRMIPYIF